MPNNWLAVDSNLPNLSKAQNPKEQIMLLFDYMVSLTQQLRYSLQNLSVSNWNTTALNELKKTVGESALAAVEQLRTQLNQLRITIGGYSGEIESIENTISLLEASRDEAQENIQTLQEDAAANEIRIDDLEQLITGEGGIEQQLADLQTQFDEMMQQLDLIQETESGLQIGGEGKEVRLVGNVYINGVLLEQEGTEA